MWSVQAEYNSREDDSINIPGFTSHRVIETGTDNFDDKGALVIDMLDSDAVDNAYLALLSSPAVATLECNTFIQAVLFISMVDTLPLDRIFESNSNFLIRPMHCEIDDDIDCLKVEDFYDTHELKYKMQPKSLPMFLEKGDAVYVENYDRYPDNANGPFSGEWCLVVDADRKNPLLFGFGISMNKYIDVKRILSDACKNEIRMIKGNRPSKKAKHSKWEDRIGISVVLKLKEGL